MTNTGRGTALFNLLLGYPAPLILEPIPPAPVEPPLEEMPEWKARKAGVAKELDLWFDGKLFTVIYWPRPDSPYFSIGDCNSMRARGFEFFDFKVIVDLSASGPTESGGTQWDIQSDCVWNPAWSGAPPAHILVFLLGCAADSRSYRNLPDFAESWGQETIDDYTELRWNRCKRCARFFATLGMTPDQQVKMRDEILEMRDREGNSLY